MGCGRQRETGNQRSRDISDIGKNETTPPDGGWGWIVVLASFMIHVIALGIVYSFGIFYVEFLDYFKGGKGETAWVGSMVAGVMYTVGPIASTLSNKYGSRFTTIAGGLIAASGFVLSLFAPNLYFLYFSFGLLGGFGFGLIYLPAIVTVGYYFEKKRSFATGLAVCGSGLGAFLFNPLAKYLIDEFGWQGAILIEAGLILNCVICGALFRPLKPRTKYKRSGDENKNDLFALENTQTNSLGDTMEIQSLIRHKHHADVTGDDMASSQPSLFQKDFKSVLPTLRYDGLSQSETALHRQLDPTVQRCSNIRHQSGCAHYLTPGDVSLSGSMASIILQRPRSTLYIASPPSIIEGPSSDIQKVSCCPLSTDVHNVMKKTLDMSLFKDPVFLMFLISNVFTSIGYHMPFIFLADRALDEGIDVDDAKWLLSAVGLSNTVGRVVFGFLADKMGLQRLILYNTALTICGVATALCPLCYSFSLLLVYACVFGITIGVYVALEPVVLVDLLGLEMLTNSFGLLLMFQGFAVLIGPPIAGWLYDVTGNYDVSFIVSGVIVATSGIMLYFIPLISARHHRKSFIVEGETLTTDMTWCVQGSSTVSVT